MNRVLGFLAVWVAAMLMATAFVARTDIAVAAVGSDDEGKGIVYLLRGGANIFSTGMDEIAEKLRDRGVNAKSVGHASWQDVSRKIRERYAEKRQPIVLIGHSFGANAAILVAEDLGKHDIPVALIVLYDPTVALQVPANVRRLVNFYSSTVQGMNLEVVASPHFTGKLENIPEMRLGHLEIDNDPELHDQTMGYILPLLGMRARTAAQ